MRNILKTLIIALFIFALTPAAFATEAKIAAVVNGEIITVNDVENRVKLYLQGKDPSKITPQDISQLTFRTLSELIDESLQMQEAKKFGITIADEQIENGIEIIAKKNNGNAEDMKKSLTASGIDISTLKSKIGAEMAWSKLINRKLYSKVSVSDAEIDMAIDNITKQDGKNYLLAEILLLVPDRSQENDIKAKAETIIAKVKQGVPFDAIAREFSQAPGANRGGDLGWIKETQLNVKLANALDNIKAGQITKPVRTVKGWHIMLLRDVKEADAAETADINKEDAKTRSNIASRLGSQRLQQMAKHYLNDLRAMALIENRL